MERNYSVALMSNGEVWGIWTFPEKPTREQEIELRKMVQEVTRGFEDKFTVEFQDNNIECDTFADLMGGIKESLEIEFRK